MARPSPSFFPPHPMTVLECARRGIVTPDMVAAAQAEGLDPRKLCRLIAQGKTVLVKNTLRTIAPLAVGQGTRVKVNANLGSSDTSSGIEEEQAKLAAAVEAGADAIMDLSTGSSITETRRRLLDTCPVALGTVPLYQAMAEVSRQNGCLSDPLAVSADAMIRAIEAHIESGVDFITVHAGLRKKHLPLADRRIMGVVSRGGSFLASWIRASGQENPLYERFDEIVALAKRRDVVLSLGDSLRPGATADAGDKAQIAELKTLAHLARRARKAGVQVIIEGPGHVSLDQVVRQVKLQKRLCRGAPFYILGPLVTDCGAGYDHIAGAIGGALAAWAGADFLCYLTPREHLGLPELAHVVDGVAASKLAAHAADLARGRSDARQRDLRMSQARAALDWEGMFRNALAPRRARELWQKSAEGEGCSMCGALCSAQVHKKAQEALV